MFAGDDQRKVAIEGLNQQRDEKAVAESETAAQEGHAALRKWGKALDDWGRAAEESTQLVSETRNALEAAEEALKESRAALETEFTTDHKIKEALERAFEFLEDGKLSLETLQNNVFTVSAATEQAKLDIEKPMIAVKAMEAALEAMKEPLGSAEEKLRKSEISAGREPPELAEGESATVWEKIRLRENKKLDFGDLFVSLKLHREDLRDQAEAWIPLSGTKARNEEWEIDDQTFNIRRGAPPEVWEAQKQAEQALMNLVEIWKVLSETAHYQLDQKSEEDEAQQKKFALYFKLRDMISEWKSLQQRIEKVRRRDRNKELLDGYWSNWKSAPLKPE